MSEMSGGFHGDRETVGATNGDAGAPEASRGVAGNGSADADARGGTWERARDMAADLRGRAVQGADALGRRMREAPLTQRLGEAIEERPWTALMIALGLGAALAAATGRGSPDTRTADVGDDYLAEYEDALVAGSVRWAARGRSAVSDVGAANAASRGATAGGTDEWRPSDEQLAGEHDALGEMGRGLPANPGAMEGRVTRESWERGMIE